MKHILRSFCMTILVLMLVSMLGTGLAETFHPEWTWPEEGTTIKGEIETWCEGDYLEKGAADFNKYYPDVKVKYVSIPWSEYWKKILITLSSNAELPDIMQFEQGSRGIQLAIDEWEVLTDAPYNLNPDDIAPTVLPIIKNEKGEITCVQFDNCVGGIAYNRDLAQEYFGVSEPEDMEKIFTSWDVYVEKAKEVNEKSGGKVTTWCGVGDVFSAASGIFMKEPFVVDKKLNLEGSVLKSFELVEQMVKSGGIGKMDIYSPAWNASFSSGNNIFYGCASWVPPYTLQPNDPDGKGRWGLMAAPDGGGYVQGGTALAIPKRKSDEKKKLAWTYIRFMALSNEGAISWMTNNAGVPAYLPSYTLPEISIPNEWFRGQPIIEKYMEITKNPLTTSRPITYYDAVIQEICNSVMKDIAKGSTAEEAYAKVMREVLAKYPELSE